MKLKSLFPLLAALALTILGSTVVAEEKGKPLIVGMELAYPPFEMTDTSGKPTGVSVDLATDLAKSLGRPVVIQNTAFDGLIPALKTGKIDLVISSMTATAERAQSIDFSEPYISTGLSLLLKKDSTAKGIADLDREGVKIAVKKGTTGHIFATNNLKKAQVNRFIKEYREKGGFEQLGERYLKEMKDEFKRLGSAFFL